MITLLKLRPYIGDIVAPSPNHGSRRAPAIEGIVLHATADAGDETRSLSWLRSPTSQASCHLLVSRAGWVTRLVGDEQRAWHAGASWWRGRSDVNSITLGIEIANRNDGEPYTDEQYDRVAAIVAHYCRQGLSIDDVVGHKDIAPGRRTDPRGWDWDRFRSMVQAQLRPVDITLPIPTPDIALPAVPDMARPSRKPTDFSLPSVPPVRAPEPAGPVLSAMPTKQVPTTAGTKPALRSRTIWLNGLTVLAAGAAIIGEGLKLAFSVGLTVPQQVTTWALFAVGLVNIILRMRTTQPLSCSCASSETPATIPAITMPVPPQRVGGSVPSVAARTDGPSGWPFRVGYEQRPGSTKPGAAAARAGGRPNDRAWASRSAGRVSR